MGTRETETAEAEGWILNIHRDLPTPVIMDEAIPLLVFSTQYDDSNWAILPNESRLSGSLRVSCFTLPVQFIHVGVGSLRNNAPPSHDPLCTFVFFAFPPSLSQPTHPPTS